MTACASAGPPPGGPEDHEPPVLITVTPDSGQVNVHPKEVEFQFDETVSGHPSAGVTSLDQLFLISPRNGDVQASWHRGRITVKPEKGFRPNTAYRVTMLPGLADLRGNVRHTGATVVFSTGPTFPAYGIIGRVFDWNLQRPAGGAYVEAISHPDTTVAYVASADTTGAFDIGPLPAGTYTVRSYIDLNHNHVIDRNEKWDSTTVVVTTSRPSVELDVIERDTVPAVFADVRVDDSVTIHVAFDKPLDPNIQLQPSLITIKRADSTALTVTKVEWAAPYDRARQAHIIDSLRVIDSLHNADTSAARRPPAPVPPLPAAARAGPAPAKPKSLPPDHGVVVTLDASTPLTIGPTYRITARGLPNLLGRSAEITRTFTMPKPVPVPRDTTHRTPADSARRPPPPPGRPPNRSELR